LNLISLIPGRSQGKLVLDSLGPLWLAPQNADPELDIGESCESSQLPNPIQNLVAQATQLALPDCILNLNHQASPRQTHPGSMGGNRFADRRGPRCA
jgi:hypothetical protein